MAEVSAGQVGGVTTMSTGPILEGEMHLSDDDGDDGGGDEGDDDGQVAGIGAISTGRFVGIKIKLIWSKNAVPYTRGWTLSLRRIFYEENQPVA